MAAPAVHPACADTAESALIRQLLPDGAPRFLVEVGAHDGVSGSTSLPFVADGWQAILVEPHPEVFERLLFVHGANPDVYCVRGACSDEPGILPLHLGAGANTMLSSLIDRRDDPALGVTQAGDTVDVEVYLLSDVLAARGWPVDYSVLLVDTEGVDAEVLVAAGLDRWRPRFIVSEDYPHDPHRMRRKHRFLWDQGYLLFDRIGPNSLWIDEPWWATALERYDHNTAIRGGGV